MFDFCDLMDCSLPSSSVHGIFQARTLEWVAMPSSRWPSQPTDWTHISCIGRWILYHWATWRKVNGSSVYVYMSACTCLRVHVCLCEFLGAFTAVAGKHNCFFPQAFGLHYLLYPEEVLAPSRMLWNCQTVPPSSLGECRLLVYRA